MQNTPGDICMHMIIFGLPFLTLRTVCHVDNGLREQQRSIEGSMGRVPCDVTAATTMLLNIFWLQVYR